MESLNQVNVFSDKSTAEESWTFFELNSLHFKSLKILTDKDLYKLIQLFFF